MCIYFALSQVLLAFVGFFFGYVNIREYYLLYVDSHPMVFIMLEHIRYVFVNGEKCIEGFQNRMKNMLSWLSVIQQNPHYISLKRKQANPTKRALSAMRQNGG